MFLCGADKFRSLCETQKTVWMGIVNLAPDSFSDGGVPQTPHSAVSKGLDLIQKGAAIIDFGGVSTNPKIKNAFISPQEELERVYPTLQLARSVFPKHILISIDTYLPQVAFLLAQENLIDIINDVCAGQRDEAPIGTTMDVAAKFKLGFVAMHMLGTPEFIPEDPHYENCVRNVVQFLKERIELAKNCGVPFVAVDPGIGYGRFGKKLQHVLELLSKDSIEQLCALDYPLLIGVSRKSFFSDLFPELKDPQSRDQVTKEFEFKCIEYGAKIIRTHEMP